MTQTSSCLLLHAAACIALVSSLTGCAKDNWQVETHPASGVIKINGESPENAIIILHSTTGPIDKRHSEPWAIINPDGTFKLTTYKDGDGAPKGEYAVTLYWPAYSFVDAPDRLSGAFNDVSKPLTTVSIAEGENKLIPIELSNIKVVPPTRAPF